LYTNTPGWPPAGGGGKKEMDMLSNEEIVGALVARARTAQKQVDN
jgi:hypothetical protein